jgi:hypothetical protein
MSRLSAKRPDLPDSAEKEPCLRDRRPLHLLRLADAVALRVVDAEPAQDHDDPGDLRLLGTTGNY